MRILTAPNGKKIVIQDNDSANALAKHPVINGNIGKTSILVLMRGQKAEAKGFRIVEIEKPYIANKLGIESIGTGKLRQRKPMTIYIKPNPSRGLTEGMQKSDFADFLTTVYKQAKRDNGQVEYSALASILGWSRNMVSVYSARAKNLGFIDIERHSNFIAR